MGRVKNNFNPKNIKVLLLGVSIVFVFLSTLPYFNIFLEPQVMFLFCIVIVISILGFPYRYVYLISIALLALCQLLLIKGQDLIAEKIAFYGFVAIFLGIFQGIYIYIFKKNEDS